jgi:hypothetical protein
MCLSIKLTTRIAFTDGLFSERLVNAALNECIGLLAIVEPRAPVRKADDSFRWNVQRLRFCACLIQLVSSD